MSDKEHNLIGSLKQQLADKVIDRREFVRYSTLLGMAAAAAYMWAGKITGEPFRAAGARRRTCRRAAPSRSPSACRSSTTRTPSHGSTTPTSCARSAATSPAPAPTTSRVRDLCSKWEASEDLKTWTFTMADATWRKGGGAFTAEHAAWNIKHCLDPKVGSSVVGLMKGYMLKDVDTGTKDDKGNAVMTTELWDANAIEVKDPKTLVLNLKEAQVAVPEHFFHYPFLMLDPAENGVFGVGSNGTGSFELVELEVGRKAILKRIDGQAGLSSMNCSSSILATIPRRLPRHLPPSRSTASTRAISSSSKSTRPWITSTSMKR